MRVGLALVFGFLAALVVAGFPASAADQSIAAQSFTGWQPANVFIGVNESVTWINGTGLSHNVCVRASGASTGCDEFRSGDPSGSWPSGGYTHPFTADGTYAYLCEQHTNMKGTITVGNGGGTTTTTTTTTTGTGTPTTPPPDTMPTDTTTIQDPTQIEQNNVAPDTSAPSFVGKPKRRASRKALIVELRSSEDATLKTTVLRRPPHGRAFSRIGEASLHITQGKNVVTLPRKSGGKPRSGSYKLRLRLVDAAGNRSAATTISFKIA
jgi:plastocyanin